MEYIKIGEIFKHKGDWYQCLETPTFSCKHCDFYDNKHDLCNISRQNCLCSERSDKKNVIFKKLEKVGEPYYNSDKKLCQQYKCYTEPLIADEIVYVFADNRIVIEVKQNKKEDMEEKKIQLKQEDIDYLTRKIRYLVYKTNDYDRATEEIMNLFIPSDTEHSSSEKIGKNLKPFDLETAKAGKPVCTRDGRKARIICFDLKNEEYPIVAAIGNDSSETLLCYTINGEIVKGNYKSDKDLMMLPEKRKGWINIHQYDVYKTKEEAEAKVFDKANYLTTIEIDYWR